jgi:GNAT superfamily N-acetyltransferase
MKLRAYQVTDLEPLLTVWWESWHSSASFRHPKPLAEWRLRWEKIARTHTVVVAEREGSLAGFAALDTERAVLSQIFVTPGLKRKGIGRALFNWARSRCPNGLTLKTLAENSESRAFYRSLGMTEQGRSINDFNGHEEVEYLLVGAA